MATRIPINKENCNFEDRQKKIWEDMEQDMERRRREWEGEIDKMRKEFFLLRPEKGAADFDSLEGPGAAPPTGRLPARIVDSEDGKPIVDRDENGQPVFKVKFNMKEYRPEEVSVKMDTNKIMVSARHEEKGTGSSVSREYNREVNIPRDVDPLALSCTLNPDGYLEVHAPLPAPKYNAIQDGSPASRNPAGVVKTSSSYQSSSSNFTPQQNLTGGPTYAPREQQQQQQQHSQVKSQVVHNMPLSHASKAASNSSSFNQTDSAVHEDHVVPSFKPPPDLSKLDLFDKPSPSSSTVSSQQRSSSSYHSAQPQPFLSGPPPHLLNSSPMPKPPFSTLSSSFPAGPIFPDSASQAQLSAPMVTSHDGKFQLTLPIEDFKPEELTVKTQDGKVIICARREVNTGNRAHTSEMSREHTLPDTVDPLTVKAFFTDTNNLIVEAPFIRS